MTSICHQTMATASQETSSEYFSSREDILQNATLGPSNVHRIPTPEPDREPETRSLQVMNPDDPWAESTSMAIDNDPDFPVGV